MPMERRKPQRVNSFRLSPDAPRSGPYKGYQRLNAIHSAADRDPSMKFCNLMHHFCMDNLRQAYRGLDGTKASGIDRVTKEQYGKNLEHNLTLLQSKIRNGGWRPKPAREVLIPKPQGGWRPLAIGCLEDKIVQTVLAKIMEAIYEPIFHERSYGFRYGRNAHQALSRLYRQIAKQTGKCTVVEMDIEKFFNSMSHEKLMAMIERRIGDPHFMRLIRRCLKNAVLSTDGSVLQSNLGSPQGAPVSPVLANIYLHYVLDIWFQENWRDGDSEMIRYADDAVFVFSNWTRAQEFQRALEDQLVHEGKLLLNMDKSRVVLFSRKTATRDIPFLGFTLYWGKFLNQKPELKVKTTPKRVNKSIQEFKDWIKKERNRHTLDVLWERAKTRIQGHYNYYGVSYNQTKLRHFYWACVKALYRWLNRRSQRRSFTWERFRRRLIFNPLPKPPLGAELKDIKRACRF